MKLFVSVSLFRLCYRIAFGREVIEGNRQIGRRRSKSFPSHGRLWKDIALLLLAQDYGDSRESDGICHLCESLVIGDALDHCKTSPIVKRVVLPTTTAKSEPLIAASRVVRHGYETTGSRALINQLFLQQVKSYPTLFAWERSDNQHSVRRRDKNEPGIHQCYSKCCKLCMVTHLSVYFHS